MLKMDGKLFSNARPFWISAKQESYNSEIRDKWMASFSLIQDHSGYQRNKNPIILKFVINGWQAFLLFKTILNISETRILQF
jgi:hypothetical protein